MVEGGHSTRGLIIISKLYQEGRIDDYQREQLKDMIFTEDAILQSLLERYDDEQDIKDAVLAYCNRGAVSSSAHPRPEVHEQPQKVEAVADAQSELDMMSSPSDSALDMLKRKRLNQMAAKQKQEQQKQAPVPQVQQQQPVPQAVSQQPPSSGIGGMFSISDCDLGASPIMKGGIFAQQKKLLSPLQQAMMRFGNSGNQ